MLPKILYKYVPHDPLHCQMMEVSLKMELSLNIFVHVINLNELKDTFITDHFQDTASELIFLHHNLFPKGCLKKFSFKISKSL